MFREGEGILLIGTHVDDIFPLCNPQGEKIRTRVLNALRAKVEVEDKGEITYALDMHIERDKNKGTLFISQKNYIDSIINEFQAKETLGKETPAPIDDIKEADTNRRSSNKGSTTTSRSQSGSCGSTGLKTRYFMCVTQVCDMAKYTIR